MLTDTAVTDWTDWSSMGCGWMQDIVRVMRGHGLISVCKMRMSHPPPATHPTFDDFVLLGESWRLMKDKVSFQMPHCWVNTHAHENADVGSDPECTECLPSDHARRYSA